MVDDVLIAMNESYEALRRILHQCKRVYCTISAFDEIVH